VSCGSGSGSGSVVIHEELWTVDCVVEREREKADKWKRKEMTGAEN